MRDLLDSTPPHERGAALARMKDTLATARIGLADLRTGLEQTRKRLATERGELETVLRRKGLAARINDAETVAIAARFEAHHAERVVVLERKLAAQQEELQLAEREVTEMAEELRVALRGGPSPRAAEATLDPASGSEAGAAAEELDRLTRARARADRDAEAAAKLEALKRRMGK